MGPRISFLTLLPNLPILLVHLAGLVASIVLMVRKRGPASTLALIGFAVLFLLDIASLGRGPLITLLIEQAGIEQYLVANAGVGCCCSTFHVAAMVCLIVAIWRAITESTANSTTWEGARNGR
ncbi:MAG: hypothetical protein GX620_01145 [Chloroflexi bacterium]|nr:hypothetical protein [Chloroflexota bacterium]